MPVTQTILWGSMGPDSHSIDTALERAVGKTQSQPHLALAWARGLNADGSINYNPFPTVMLKPAYDRGSVVLLDWCNWRTDNHGPDPLFTLQTVIGGMHDAFITKWAQAAATFGKTLMLRFDWEMQGSWFPWGNQPTIFAQAWQHVHDLFTAAGAANVRWVWCPNALSSTNASQIAAYYPGDSYVDWTGFDAYNNSKGTSGWVTFSQMVGGGAGGFGPTYQTLLSIAPSKPMLIGEFAAWDTGGDKGAWLADALTVLPTSFPQIRAINYENWTPGGAHWPLAMPSTAMAGFAGAISSPIYLPAGTLRIDANGVPTTEVNVLPSVAGTPFALIGPTWDVIAEGLTVELGSAQTQLGSVQTQLSTALASLTSQASTAQAQIDALNAQITTLQAQLAQAQNTAQQTTNAQVQALQQHLADAQAALSTKQALIGTYVAALSALQQAA